MANPPEPVVLKKRFLAVMKAIAEEDIARLDFIAAPVAHLIPKPPDPLELRGPSWSTIARGAAPLPGPQSDLLPNGAMTPPPIPAGEPASGPPPLEVGAEVAYAGMVGRVVQSVPGVVAPYVVMFPNGARVTLSDRDLGRV